MGVKTVTHHGITFDGEVLETFCLKNGIKRLSLFGSVLRDGFESDSDIDMLVEFMSGEVVGFFRLISVERSLSELFGGRKVDLRTPQDLSKYFRNKVLAEAEDLYVCG